VQYFFDIESNIYQVISRLSLRAESLNK